MAALQSIDTPDVGSVRPIPSLGSVGRETRMLLAGTLIGVGVGIGLSFLSLILGLVMALNHPGLTGHQADLRFLAPFGVGIVVMLALLLARGVRRVGGGVLVGVAVGAAATLAVVGGLLAGSGIQR